MTVANCVEAQHAYTYIISENCVILGCHFLDHGRLCSSLKTLCHLSPIPLSRIIHVCALYRMMDFIIKFSSMYHVC